MGITGTIPDSWAEMGRLEELDVRQNRLGGPIPKAVLQVREMPCAKAAATLVRKHA